MKTGNTLILLAHPAYAASRVNRAMVDAVADLPGVTVHDLAASYPDFRIDVAREQALLLSHDTIVFQHPLYWYAAPAILKQWQDEVLTLGFAYGPGGNQLAGRRCFNAVSTGGPEVSYQTGSYNNYPLETLLLPYRQLANLTGMEYLPVFAIYGAARKTDDELLREVLAYRERLTALQV